MPGYRLARGHALLIASRGSEPHHGLVRCTQDDGVWQSTLLARVDQLSCLVRHPALPIVYGCSGTATEGHIWAWRIENGAATLLSHTSSGGREPCHVAVGSTGRMLFVTNYETSTIGALPLASDGRFEGAPQLLALDGSGPVTDRQQAAHPHQAIVAGNTLYVVDLGADVVREFAIDRADDADALRPTRTTSLPSGTGPRHGVVLPDGRLAVSGELASTLVVGRPGDPPEAWAVVPSTLRTGPVKPGYTRNFPGDIQQSRDGRLVYVANRGYDTVATFHVGGALPLLIRELDAGVAWPQHLMIVNDQLLVAGWDSSSVAAMPLSIGQPGAAVPILECAGAGWLLLFD